MRGFNWSMPQLAKDSSASISVSRFGAIVPIDKILVAAMSAPTRYPIRPISSTFLPFSSFGHGTLALTPRAPAPNSTATSALFPPSATASTLPRARPLGRRRKRNLQPGHMARQHRPRPALAHRRRHSRLCIKPTQRTPHTPGRPTPRKQPAKKALEFPHVPSLVVFAPLDLLEESRRCSLAAKPAISRAGEASNAYSAHR